jgi:putative transposase
MPRSAALSRAEPPVFAGVDRATGTGFAAADDGPAARAVVVLKPVRSRPDRGRPMHPQAQLARFASEHNLVRSGGRTTVCWENARAESFWATMKVEFCDRYHWSAKAAAKLAIGDWIARVYSPIDFEDRFIQTARAA